jgi:hypothetical protein
MISGAAARRRPEVVMRARSPVLLAVLLLAAAPTGAQEPRVQARGPFIALRAGVGLPYGDIADGGPAVEDLVDRKIPLALELGYRFNRRVWGQLFFDLAPASAASALCAGEVDCSASDFRTGLAFLFRMAPGARLDPWVGIGVAIEVLNAEGQNVDAGAPYEWSWFGLELPFATLGVDWAVSERIAVGPWASATVARFTSDSVRASGGETVSGSVQDRAVHGWISAGLKATLRL